MWLAAVGVVVAFDEFLFVLAVCSFVFRGIENENALVFVFA